MRRARRRLFVGACVLAVAGTGAYAAPVLATGGAGPGSGSDQLAGCQASRPATAFRTGAPVVPQPPHPPVPCLVATGFSGSEAQVVSLNDGTLVYEPAIITPGLAGTGFLPGLQGPRPSTALSPAGLAFSADRGANWSFVAPAGATWVAQDDSLYADPLTGRLFYYALAANPAPQAGVVPPQDQIPAGEAHLMMSPDEGKAWNEVGLVGFVESENPRFTSAPAPAGQAVPAGYPDVVYWCGNNAVNLGLPLPGYRACYRSLDGGVTWALASTLDSGPVPQHSQCGNTAETFADMDPNYPEGAPDGSLYSEVQCGSTTYLARSRDEASTWPLVTDPAGQPITLPTNGELRVDRDGTLYLANLGRPAEIDLRVSHDGGVRWSPPVNMTHPGTGAIVQWAFAERSGEVAVSYLEERGSQPLYDGYLSVSRNPLDPFPVFWSSALNPSSAPMRTSAPPGSKGRLHRSRHHPLR